VCNAYGYDKSVIRALALQVRLWAAHRIIGDPGMVALADRVLAAEEEARPLSRCRDIHPIEEDRPTAGPEAERAGPPREGQI
jgi:hypothetical protein